jgi:hypothetical protein
VLADVGHLAQVRVQPRGIGGLAEGLLVHARAAGGNDDAIELMLRDRLLEKVLPRVRAHVLVIAGEGDAGDLRRPLCDLLHIHGAGDVLAAVANKNADSGHRFL